MSIDKGPSGLETQTKQLSAKRGHEEELRFETKLLHFGGEIDRATGASSVPIYQASTFHHEDIFNPPQHDYSRSGNPTRQALEDYIALLEGGVRGFAYASGMAAISSSFIFAASSGIT